MGLDDALLLAALHLRGIGAVAQQQTYGTNDDAFAGSGLACDDRETRAEVNVEFVDESKILDI